MAERERLNTPGERKRSLFPKVQLDSDSFGRFAEWVAERMGTPSFLGWMTVFVITWVTLNVVSVWHFKWDPYPFILLNLFFSTQASYSAPLILLAQNRQADRDRVALEQDRSRDERNLADTEFLTREVASLRLAMRETATRDFVRSTRQPAFGGCSYPLALRRADCSGAGPAGGRCDPRSDGRGGQGCRNPRDPGPE